LVATARGVGRALALADRRLAVPVDADSSSTGLSAACLKAGLRAKAVAVATTDSVLWRSA
jgi:hypothetical protein